MIRSRNAWLWVAAFMVVGFPCSLTAVADPFSNPSSWKTYDPGANGVGIDPGGFADGVFDGERYVYFAPGYSPTYEVLRFDTLADFTSASSWTAFSPYLAGLTRRVGYQGAVVAGDYVYFVPLGRGCGTGGYDGQVVRYQRNGEFTDAYSWEAFDSSEHGVGTPGTGFAGNAAFDGRYIYFPPGARGNGPCPYSAEVRRYDTNLPFGEASSWSVFTPAGALGGYFGALVTGGYVYFAPHHDGAHGQVLRYSTSGEFTDQGSWEMFDAGDNGVGTDPDGYGGLMFGGGFVYFVPMYNGAAYHGEVLRYNTTGLFTDAGSWQTFNATALDPEARGYYGSGVFDGRFVYFPPLFAAGRTMLRHDTTASFADPESWDVIEPNALGGYQGAVFDGRFVYFVPSIGAGVHGEVLRYDTKDTDDDGVSDSADNCSSVPNSDQADSDADGVGDVCDNCPNIANPGQADCNSNGTGDECDIAHDCCQTGHTGTTKYAADFSSDPGWITDQPGNYFWDAPMGTYRATTVNAQPGPSPTRYAYKLIDYDGGSFTLEFEMNPESLGWSAGVVFGLFDPSLHIVPGPESPNAHYIHVHPGRSDGGLSMPLYVRGMNGISHAEHIGWNLFTEGTWCRCVVTYDAATDEARLTVTVRDTGAFVGAVTVTDIGGLPNDLDYLGFARDRVGDCCPPVGAGCSGYSCSTSATASIDNITLTECTVDCNSNGTPDADDIAHDCCQTGHGAGCSFDPIESCVCTADRYCCLVEWDQACVDRATSGECGPCDIDCNANAVPDECDIADGTSQDCQPDRIPDECQTAGDDCDANGVPDECEPDCDGDGLINACDPDMDNDGVPNEQDECDNTPVGKPVDATGHPLGDINRDCATDAVDWQLFQQGFTGPLAPC